MKFSFKSFKGEKGIEAESSQNQQAKRKEQVRRAQKTHRERKEVYTRSLEQEVLRLRANETKILEETRKVYAELNDLKKLIAQHGIEVAAIRENPQTENEISVSTSHEDVLDVNIRISNTKQRRRQIQVFKQSPHPQADLATSVNQYSLSSYPLSSPVLSEELTSTAASNQAISELDLTAVGVNFVLTLESPCLSHITDAPSDSETGHALMASATILHQHPQHQYSHVHSDQNNWQISALGIERLLHLSSNIPISEGELTPVQAWDVLRQHPGFPGLDLARLRVLMEGLINEVKCYGFGGVIDQNALNNALFETFVVGKVF